MRGTKTVGHRHALRRKVAVAGMDRRGVPAWKAKSACDQTDRIPVMVQRQEVGTQN